MVACHLRDHSGMMLPLALSSATLMKSRPPRNSDGVYSSRKAVSDARNCSSSGPQASSITASRRLAAEPHGHGLAAEDVTVDGLGDLRGVPLRRAAVLVLGLDCRLQGPGLVQGDRVAE